MTGRPVDELATLSRRGVGRWIWHRPSSLEQLFTSEHGSRLTVGIERGSQAANGALRVGAAVADAGRTVVQPARDHDVSWPVVAAAALAG